MLMMTRYRSFVRSIAIATLVSFFPSSVQAWNFVPEPEESRASIVEQLLEDSSSRIGITPIDFSPEASEPFAIAANTEEVLAIEIDSPRSRPGVDEPLEACGSHALQRMFELSGTDLDREALRSLTGAPSFGVSMLELKNAAGEHGLGLGLTP